METLESYTFENLGGPLRKNRGTERAAGSLESKTVVKLGRSFIQLKVRELLHQQNWI